MGIEVFEWLSWFTLDFVEVGSPECSTGNIGYAERWWLSATLPFMLLLPFAGIFAWSQYKDAENRAERERLEERGDRETEANYKSVDAAKQIIRVAEEREKQAEDVKKDLDARAHAEFAASKLSAETNKRKEMERADFVLTSSHESAESTLAKIQQKWKDQTDKLTASQKKEKETIMQKMSAAMAAMNDEDIDLLTKKFKESIERWKKEKESQKKKREETLETATQGEEAHTLL